MPDVRHEEAVDAVRKYLSADADRCMPTCRVGCPCDGGMEDAATGAPDAAQEIVDIVLAALGLKPPCGHLITPEQVAHRVRVDVEARMGGQFRPSDAEAVEATVAGIVEEARNGE